MDKEFRNITVDENCPDHGGPLEVYCLDHSSMCCHTCVSVAHKNCNYIKPIDHVMRTGTTSRETAWENIKDEATKMFKDDESKMNVLNSKEKKVSVKAMQMIEEVKDKLESLNTAFQSELEDTCKKLRKQLSDRMNCVKKFLTNAENSNILMTLIDKLCTDRQRFIMREKTKHQMSRHYRRMDHDIKKLPNTFDLKLNIKAVIDDIMKLTSIAKVDVTSNMSPTSQDTNTCIRTSLATLMSAPSASTFADSTSASDLVGSPTQGSATVDVWTGSVSCALSLNSGSLGGVQTPYLAGGIFTDSGELLVTDLINSRLVLFDVDYCYKSEYKVDGMPTDITRGVDTDEILVGISDGFMRCTLRNGQLTENETVGCKGLSGLAVLGDNILVCTDCDVKILSMDGKFEKKTIPKKRGIPSIAASTSLSTFYYSDGDAVVCRRLDSDVEDYRYSNPGLRNPAGIGLDHDNNVYVCGYDSRNVYIFSSDGSREKALVPRLSSITKLWGIFVNPTKPEFVVTSNMETSSLELYRFSDNAGVDQ